MIRKEELVIGTKEELLDYFRNDLGIALKIDQNEWNKKIKKVLDDAKQNEKFELPEEYQKFLVKMLSGSREISDKLQIDQQLDSVPQHHQQVQVFYFEAKPKKVVDDIPTIELILKSVYVKIITQKEKETLDQHHLATV